MQKKIDAKSFQLLAFPVFSLSSEHESNLGHQLNLRGYPLL
jgi:hypothetical protein